MQGRIKNIAAEFGLCELARFAIVVPTPGPARAFQQEIDE
jgi:hypothetical protein